MPRIIAGIASGRPLRVPASGTRPTSDRAREALFSSLQHRLQPGGFDGIRVLDAFAGSGALGLEALSRGAGSVDLVDSQPAAADVARQNADAVGIPGARVHRQAISSFLAGREASGPGYDLVLLDPPYAMPANEIEQLLAHLEPHLAEEAVVVLERGKHSEPVAWPEGFVVAAERAYSQARITIALW